jgi:hypothetical protein
VVVLKWYRAPADPEIGEGVMGGGEENGRGVMVAVEDKPSWCHDNEDNDDDDSLPRPGPPPLCPWPHPIPEGGAQALRRVWPMEAFKNLGCLRVPLSLTLGRAHQPPRQVELVH